MVRNDLDPVFATAFLAKMGRDEWPMDVLTRTDHRYDHLAAIPSAYIVCEQDNGLPPEWQDRFLSVPGRRYAPARSDIQGRALRELDPEYMIRLYEDFRRHVIGDEAGKVGQAEQAG